MERGQAPELPQFNPRCPSLNGAACPAKQQVALERSRKESTNGRQAGKSSRPTTVAPTVKASVREFVAT
ncbi:MAG: hypothetical protein ACKO81_02980, partial [Planctomycetota bacterium]